MAEASNTPPPAESTRAHLAYRMRVMQGIRRAARPEVRLGDVLGSDGWFTRLPIGISVSEPEACRQLARDERLVQGWPQMMSAQGVPDGPVLDWLRGSMLCAEGETHARLRRTAARAFSRARIEQARPDMRSRAHQLIDSFVDRGRCEFMADFATPFPAQSAAQVILGTAAAEHERVADMVARLGAALTTRSAEQAEAGGAALAALFELCDAVIEDRRRRPAGDVISDLLTPGPAGDRLTGEELRSLVVLLLFAGQDAGRNQLGLAMLSLLHRPADWSALARSAPGTAELVDRLIAARPATQALIRYATEDFQHLDAEFHRGDTVLLLVGPGEAGDPAGTVSAFGAGIHYCLGANLARAQFAEALPVLAARLGPLAPAGDVQWRPPMGVSGPETLPLSFTPPASSDGAAPGD